MSDAHLTIYRAVKLKSNPISAHYRSDSEKHKQSFLPSLPKDSLSALVECIAATLLHTLEQCLH